MAKTIETRYIIRGEDQVTPVSQRIERGWDKVNAALQESGKAQVLDTGYWNRISGVVRETTREYEKLANAAKSVAKETANIGPGLGRGMRPLPPGVVFKGGAGTVPVFPGWEGGATTIEKPGMRPLPPGVVWRGAGGGPIPSPPPGPLGAAPTGPWAGAPPEMATKWRQVWGQLTGQIPIGPDPGGPGGRGKPTVPSHWSLNIPPTPPTPPSNLNLAGLLRLGPRAIQAVSGGVPGVMGGISQAGGLLAGLGTGGLIAGGALSAIAAGAVAAHRLAQPALSIQNLQQPLRIRMGGARVAGAREFGARYGYTPEETLQTLGAMERTGSQAGFEAMARLRLQAGIEPETAAQLSGTVTAAGGVRPGDAAGYERFAKLIAVAIADKTKLPSVPQYLEQMNSLMQLSTNYLSDITENDTATIAAIAKWQETSGTSLLRGQRGAQTIAGVANWVAKTEDPAAQAMIYQALQNSPEFQAEMNSRLTKGVEEGRYYAPQSEWWKFQMTRGMPGAWLPALSGVTKAYGNQSDLGAYMLSQQLNMSPEHAATLYKLGREYEGDVGKISAGFKTETGKDLEQILKPQDEMEMRRRQAEIAEQQLKLAEVLAGDVMNLNASMTALLVQATPFLQLATVTSQIIIDTLNLAVGAPLKIAADFGNAVYNLTGLDRYVYGKDELKSSGAGGGK